MHFRTKFSSTGISGNLDHLRPLYLLQMPFGFGNRILDPWANTRILDSINI